MTPAKGLFVSDVDGTLVTPDKLLTPAALEAAAELRAAGARFTLVSSRPPRGMAPLVAALGVDLPFAAFNGASLVGPDLRVIESHPLDPEAAALALGVLDDLGIEPFVFAGEAWLIRNPPAALIERERRAVGFEPTVVAGFESALDDIHKIVAASPDARRLDEVESRLRGRLDGRAGIDRSQPYYVDVVHAGANKGEAVKRLAARLGASLADTIVIGDMTNDLSMFRVAGFAIAMGQAPPLVRASAAAVTRSNSEDGFAAAVQGWVLPRMAATGAA